jgi:two-component system, OmpR family, phosphate regulon response regulator PhoB
MKRKSVLIADDNADMLELLRWVFEVEGFTVRTAEDGNAALRAIEDMRPDVVITDLMMPQVNGLELIRLLRHAPQWAAIPVIAASAYPEEILDQAHAAGATRVMRKPLEFNELIEAVNQCLADGVSPVPGLARELSCPQAHGGRG